MKKGIKLLLTILAFLTISKVNALELTQQEYESYNITRAYIVGDYIFDLSKHNPTLKDFLLAGQSLPKGEVSIIEIKMAENLDGEIEKEYRELLDSKTLDSFPEIDVKYIYQSEIIPDNPEAEKKILLGSKLTKPIVATDEETDELVDMVIYENEKQNHYITIANLEDYFNEDFMAEIENVEDYCLDYSCFGIDVYSVSNNKYTFVDKININELKVMFIIPLFPIEVTDNESTEFAIKVFLETPNEGIKYSEYSDTFTLNALNIDKNFEIPELNISLGKYEYSDGQYNYQVNIDFSDYCGETFDPETCDVLSTIFEYENDQMAGMKLHIPPKNIINTYMEASQSKNYYIEVLIPSEDEKYYYSVKSNQLSIKAPSLPKTEIPAVILNNSVELISKDEDDRTETYKITYELSDELKAYCQTNSCTNAGVTLYETYDSEIYDELDTKKLNDNFVVEVADYDVTTMLAKVYIETADGKIYGLSSNEITITPTDLEE